MRKLAIAAVLLGLVAFAAAQENVKITNGPVIEQATDNQAIIAWSTNVNSGTVLRYGTDAKQLNQTAKAQWGGTDHRVTVQNLEPNKTYYFRVVANEAEGTGSRARSDVFSFTTPSQGGTPLKDVKPQTAAAATQQNPQSDQGFISGTPTAQDQSIINYGPTIEKMDSNSATLYFKTSVPSSAIARFGLDVNNMNETAQAAWGGQEHRINLVNLTPSTTYYFQIKAGEAQGSGTSSYSNKFKFTTPAAGAAAQTNVQPQPAQ